MAKEFLMKHLLSKLNAVLICAALLSACGGGESSLSSSAEPSLNKTAQQPDNLVVTRDEAAERLASKAFEAKNLANGVLDKQAYYPNRVVARLLNSESSSGAAQKQSSQLASLGLRQISGFETSKLAGNTNKSAAGTLQSKTSMAVFEITQTGLSVKEAVDRLMSSGMVAYAEPDYKVHKTLAPNDANHGIFWHLKNTGQSGGLVGNDIAAETAWNTSTGNGSVVVAVVDDGVKYDHPDLSPNMWSSAGTTRVVVAGDISGAAGVIDDLNGANLSIDRVASDTSLLPYNRQDSDHGTMVAGFVGARGNNSQGGSGASWNIKVMGIKIEGPAPEYSLAASSLANAVRYAIAKKVAGVNVRVINISYGLYVPSQALKEAIEEANTQGIMVVVAAGNDGSNDERTVAYPSGYKTPNLISVGALDRFNQRASFSNYGPLVHLFAPGANVPTTSSRASLSPATGFIAPYYRYTDGTSFASPIVAGAAALLWMQYPTESLAQIKKRLLNGTSPFLTTAESLTGGKLNLANAIAPTVACSATAPIITELTTQVVSGATHRLTAYIKSCDAAPQIEVTVNGTISTIADNGVYPDEFANDGYYSGTFTGPASVSSANVTVRVQDSNGTRQVSKFPIVKTAKTYVTSTVAFSWDFPQLEADYTAAVGTLDEGAIPLSLPFPVNFDGRLISNVFMSTNGYLCLDDINCYGSDTSPLPAGKDAKPFGSTQAIVAPWWNDWQLCNGLSAMHAEIVGTAPNRRLVATWVNMIPYGIACGSATSTGGATFQVIGYENQSYFDFRYRNVSTYAVGAVSNSSGLNGSAGVQLSGGKLGTQLFYKTAFLTGVQAIRFTPQSPSFTDVAAADFFAISVEGLRGARITTGCSATLFCAEIGRGTPDAQIKTTQQQMAAFLARGINGHDLLFNYTPFPASGYTDVFSTFTKYVNFLKSKNIMTGTGSGATQFCVGGDCNADFVTRAQMARYLVKAVRGGDFIPAPATGIFTDVPTSHPEAAYIEEVARMKITLGIGNNQYGPSNIVTRGQMATFLQRTFRPFDPH
jgi:subtilisin family serine protease